jgi:acyl-CoA synthetase (NDP forming)/GNAT superfamily N-acetyltransferase
VNGPWESDVVLSDGSTVHIRPIVPQDKDGLIAFHDRQTRESLYYRYFSAKAGLSEHEAERFTNVDMVNRVGLVVEEGDRLIAWASFDRWPGRQDADVAFLTDDSHHGRGIATILLEHLAAIAIAVGVTRFTAEVLGDNRAMLSVFTKAGWPVRRAFESGVVDLSWDLQETPAFLDTLERREQISDSRSVARLLNPRSVAVIGASGAPHSVGWAVLRNLIRGAFPGPVFAVNPNRAEIAGLVSHPTIEAIDEDVSLAVVAVPVDALWDVIAACGRKRVRGAIVLTAVPDGYPSAELVSMARRWGVRIIGPGSMGVFSTTEERPLVAHIAPGMLHAGPVAVSMQSGSLGASFLDLAQRLGLGVSSFVSLGIKADISGNDLLQYWDEDARTRVIAMYTESFGNPRKFARIARRVARRRPIIAVRAGDGMIGSDTDAIYQQAGVIRVPSVRELLDTVRLLASQPVPKGNRVAIVTNSRSPAVLATGAMSAAGLVVPGRGGGPWTELGWDATPRSFADTVSGMLADPAVDAVLAIHAPPVADSVDAPAAALDAASRALATTPLVTVLLGRDDGPLLPGSAVPAYAFPEQAVAALGRAARYSAWRDDAATDQVRMLGGVDLGRAAAVIGQALALHPAGTLLPLPALEELLGAYAVPFAPAVGVTSVDGARAAADRLGYPVVLKSVDRAPNRRGVAGGVALDLADGAAVTSSWAAIEEARSHAIVEAMVQRMVPGGVEVRIQLHTDPALGPVVTVGLGGIFADAIGDRVSRLPPLTPAAAAEMAEGSRVGVALKEDPEATARLVDLLERISRMIDDHSEIDVLDLNPVLVGTDACWVVDATVHVSPPPDAVLPLRRLG